MKNVSENIKDSDIQLQTGLPKNWELVSLGSIVKTITYGHTAPSTYEPVGPKFLRITDIQKDHVQWDDVPYCKCENIEKYKLKRGDIVIARTGATTGKNYLLEHLPESTVFASYLIRLETFEEPAPEYLSLYMKSQNYWEQITTVSKGSAQPGANASVLSKLTVPIAPIQQQTRIVTAIESLQQRSSKARTLLTEVEPLIDKLQQSILQSAFSGRLTADWRAKNPDVEPADQLLARIRVERRQRWEDAELAKFEAKGKTPSKGWRDKYREPEPVDESGLPELPEGWCWASADAVAFVTKLAGFEYTKFVKYDESGDLPVIKAENAGPLGFKTTDYSRVNSELVKELTRSRIVGNDVLMVFVGAGVGQVALVPDDQEYFLGPNIAMLRIQSNSLCAQYLEHYLRSPLGFGLAMSFTKAVAQPSLSMGTIRKIPIPIPPVGEQIEIEDKLNRVTSYCTGSSSRIKNTGKYIDLLNQSILAKAFRGQLVPQDPNDEPASELLARIKAASEAEASAKKVSKKKTPRRKKKASP